MEYERPELILLGDGARLIEGSNALPESGGAPPGNGTDLD